MTHRAPRTAPIFILGVSPRSGTNFLWDLLCSHPDCAPGREPVRENFFLEHADLLLRFVDQVSARWDPAWGPIDRALTDGLRASLGSGLIDFLTVDPTRRLVVKTPSVRNIATFFELFPDASLLVLVRDGRSVVQSCMATFGWDFDTAARRWAAAADEVLRFQAEHSRAAAYRLMRYEDLLDDLEGTLTPLLESLRLDVDRFDFAAASALPVRGSSEYFGAGRTTVHWEPVPKDPRFDPRQRWRSWTARQLERFSWIAGTQQVSLGYGLSVHRPSGPRAVVHRLADLRWSASRLGGTAVFALRRHLGPPSRPLRRRLGLVADRPAERDA
jgi:hypothetical protein